MIDVSIEKFQIMVDKAIDQLPDEHRAALDNIGFFVMDKPTQDQLRHGDVHEGYTLLGLYEGIPLSQRQGQKTTLPDRITIFRLPHLVRSRSLAELQVDIHHTIWHEVAHYFGLDHQAIAGLES